MIPSEIENSFYSEERFWKAIEVIRKLREKLDALSPEGMREEQVIKWLEDRGYTVIKNDRH